jgi:hypothetical protein
MSNKVFIGNDFEESQYLWLIPIVNGYCKKNGINELLFEKKLSLRIYKNNIIKNILKKYKIYYITNTYKYNFYKWYLLFINLFSIVYYSIQVNRKNILNAKNSWKTTQLFHSIWDLSLILSKELEPNFFFKFKAASICFVRKSIAKDIYEKKTVTAFLGHSVYSSRALISELREYNIKIFNQANFNIHRQYKLEDSSWSIIDNKTISKFKYLIDKKKIDKYFNKRIIGRGYYEDSKIALIFKKNNENLNFDNVILLHIFKDSPFNLIDTKRIFVDYIEWIVETLKIISFSKENWVLRVHPNFKRWGEDSSKIVDLIVNQKLHLKNLPSNIILEKPHLRSNLDLFKNVKRLVTFSGTSHLESACFGVKPIVISKTALGEYNKNAVFKPSNYKQYYDLLIKNNDKKFFRLPNSMVRDAKLLLFIRENILSIKNDLNGLSLYRSDKKEIIRKNFYNISNNLEFNLNYLNLIGSKLFNGFTHSLSKKYINFF